MAKAGNTKQDIKEIERVAVQQAKYRAQVARWSIEIAIFLVAVLIAIIIMVAREVNTVVVALAAVISLLIVWVTAWWQGNRLYKRFYYEELRRLRLEYKGIVELTIEEEVAEKVREALKRRWEQ
ncbi:hypothetical protein ACFLVG_01400 [Chloroflexota bacterium]